MTESERYGKWEVVQSISRGGQGRKIATEKNTAED